MRDPHAKDASLDLSFYRDWVAKREEARTKHKDRATSFATISREFGCLGFDVATSLIDKIEERTGARWSLFTRSIIEDMAASPEFDSEDIHEVSERRWSFKDWFVDALVPNYMRSQSTQVYERMRNIILNMADKGHCVILGAGSQIITHRLDPKKFDGVHIRVAATYDWRVHRLEGLYNVDRNEAENLVRARQSSRDRFIADFTSMDAADPSLYHLQFNNAKNDTETMAEIIYRYLELRGAFEE
jgi:cytidylate kinase